MTRFTFAPVHVEIHDVLPGLTVGKQVGEIVERGPSAVYCGIENISGGGKQPGCVVLIDLAPRGERVDPGPEENLVCVDVAESCDRALI
jgi:hypothetical protein